MIAGTISQHSTSDVTIVIEAYNCIACLLIYTDNILLGTKRSNVAASINIYICINDIHVVNFDALAQASDSRIERGQVVFLCWMQDSNQGLWNRISIRLNACWQTDWAIKDQAKNLNSIAFSPLDPTSFCTWLWRYTCLLLFIAMLLNRQAIFESNGDKCEPVYSK